MYSYKSTCHLTGRACARLPGCTGEACSIQVARARLVLAVRSRGLPWPPATNVGDIRRALTTAPGAQQSKDRTPPVSSTAIDAAKHTGGSHGR